MDPRLLASQAALNEGRKSEAADLLIGHLSETGEAPRAIYAQLLKLLVELRRTDDGLLWSERAIARMPDDFDVLSIRGAFLRMAGRPLEAVALFDRASRLRPADVGALLNQAYCHVDAGNGAAAEQLLSRLIQKQPRDPRPRRALARALILQGKSGAAEVQLRQLLSVDNRDVDAWLELSAAAAHRADHAAAIALLDRALQALPDEQRLLQAKATTLRLSGNRHETRSFLTGLLPGHGSKPWVLHQLSNILPPQEVGQAIALLRRAIELEPQNAEYRLALALRLLTFRPTAEGSNLDIASSVLSGAPRPAKLEAHEAGIRANVFSLTADFPGIEALGDFASLTELFARYQRLDPFLTFLGRVETAGDRRLLVERHRQVGDALIEQARINPIRTVPRGVSRPKIRIGFMSSDLRDHPVTCFAWPLFEHVDRERFEIYCYSWFEGTTADATQQRIASMVDMFRWHPAIGDREAAQLIADDDLDILFEMGGMTQMNRLNVMAWKPARLCASWLGYPHSAGFSTIDHLLVDPFLAPADPALMIEKPLTMPRSWITMSEQAFPDRHAIDPVAPIRRNGHVTFGTANSPYKYNRAMLRSWARVLARIPDSRFIFVRPEAGSRIFRDNVLNMFAAEGVAGDRVDFRAIRGDHMRHYNDIDIALDTFPQTGGTTTCEALWMGVPTVTLIGEALFERLSYSILSNAGLPDLCAGTEEAFVEVAVRLARDPERIQTLRTGLRDQVRASPLGQPERFARDFYDLVARTVEASTAPLPQSPATA